MRAEARQWLDRLAASRPSKNRVWQGVAGVADAATRARNTSPHPAPHLRPAEKPEQNQRATPATPCHTSKLEGEWERHTSEGGEQGVAKGGDEVLQAVDFNEVAAPMLDYLDEVAKRSKARGTIVEGEPWRRSKRTNREPVTFFTISSIARGVKAGAGPLVSLGDKLTLGPPYTRYLIASTFGRGSNNLLDYGGNWPRWLVVVDGNHVNVPFPKSPDAFDAWFAEWTAEADAKVLGDWRDEARADGALDWLQAKGTGHE